MKRAMYYKRLECLIKAIDYKLACLPEKPFGADFTFFYPDGRKEHLSDAEFKKLTEEIEACFKHNKGEKFCESLRVNISRKKIKARELYNSALIEKSYFYQLLSGRHLPSRDVAIRICLALKLTIAESEKLLQTLGYSFFEKNRRDIIIVECLKHKAGLYIAEMLLDKYMKPSLCNKELLTDNKPFKAE